MSMNLQIETKGFNANLSSAEFAFLQNDLNFLEHDLEDKFHRCFIQRLFYSKNFRAMFSIEIAQLYFILTFCFLYC